MEHLMTTGIINKKKVFEDNKRRRMKVRLREWQN